MAMRVRGAPQATEYCIATLLLSLLLFILHTFLHWMLRVFFGRGMQLGASRENEVVVWAWEAIKLVGWFKQQRVDDGGISAAAPRTLLPEVASSA